MVGADGSGSPKALRPEWWTVFFSFTALYTYSLLDSLITLQFIVVAGAVDNRKRQIDGYFNFRA